MKKVGPLIADLIAKAKDFKKYYWLIFLIPFATILILESLVLKEAYGVVLAVKKKPEALKAAQGVRIQFDDYTQAIRKIEGAKNFQGTINIERDPFK
jgi:hypothetical protein